MRKRYLYAGIIATSMILGSCSDDYTDWAAPQTWEQEAVQDSISDGVIAPVDTLVALDDVENVRLARFVSAKNITDGSTIKYTKVTLNGDVELDCETNGDTLLVSADKLQTAIQSYYNSLESVARDVTFDVSAVIVNADGVASPLAFTDNSVKVNVTSMDMNLPAFSNDEAFYYVGGYNSWNLASPTLMESNGDGTYSCIIELAAGSEWFCFAPKSAVDAQDWNSLFRAQKNGDDATSGFFNLDPTSGFSFCFDVQKDGKYKFTINPKAWTYSYQSYTETMFYAGDANGWTFSPLAKSGDAFVGYYYIYQPDNASTWGFKLTAADNWDVSYGAGDGDNSIALDGGNIQITSPSGFYQLSVDMSTMTYSLSAITQVSLIGSAVNGDSSWSTDYDLTFNTETMAWEGTYTMTDGEFKLRANHDWTLSWGGDLDALTSQMGANISIAAGTYTFKFKPNCDGQGTLSITAE